MTDWGTRAGADEKREEKEDLSIFQPHWNETKQALVSGFSPLKGIEVLDGAISIDGLDSTSVADEVEASVDEQPANSVPIDSVYTSQLCLNEKALPRSPPTLLTDPLPLSKPVVVPGVPKSLRNSSLNQIK